MNEKRYLRYWIAVILASVVISLLSSCKHYEIEQDVMYINGDLFLVTRLVETDDISFSERHKTWFDETITDSVKCLRYNQAKELAEKIEAVENYKCE